MWLKRKYFFSCLVSFFCLLGHTIGRGSVRCIDRRGKQHHTYLPFAIMLVNSKIFLLCLHLSAFLLRSWYPTSLVSPSLGHGTPHTQSSPPLCWFHSGTCYALFCCRCQDVTACFAWTQDRYSLLLFEFIFSAGSLLASLKIFLGGNFWSLCRKNN